jgi:hypothetical protein
MGIEEKIMRSSSRWGGIVASVAIAAAAPTGCGDSTSHRRGSRGVSLPAYGAFPATTVAARPATDGVCRSDARIFADDALDFLAHFGRAAAYPADLNFVILREDLARYAADGCDSTLLGASLGRRLTPAQRRELVANLPDSMARVVREGLARANR